MTEFSQLVTTGSPFISYGALILLAILTYKVSYMADNIKEMKGKMVNSDLCDARHDEMNRRLNKLEDD